MEETARPEADCSQMDDDAGTPVKYVIEATYMNGVKAFAVDEMRREVRYETEAMAKLFSTTVKQEARVTGFTKVRKVTAIPQLDCLSDLQAQAEKNLGLSPRKTLYLAAELHDKGILSFPITDSRVISSETSEGLIRMIVSLKGNAFLASFIDRIGVEEIKNAMENRDLVSDRQLDENKRDALVPTGKKVEWDQLSKDEADLYTIICKRFLAQFLGPMETDVVTLETVSGNVHLLSKGKNMVKNGFSEIYGYSPAGVQIPDLSLESTIQVVSTDIAARR